MAVVPDRDDAPPLGPGPVDRRGGLRRDGEALGVHAVLAHVVDLDGAEGAGAHVEDDLRALDAAGAQAVEELRREVQAGGGRGDGARLAGVDRLVAVAVRRGRPGRWM